jgi:hypothetical protein
MNGAIRNKRESLHSALAAEAFYGLMTKLVFSTMKLAPFVLLKMQFLASCMALIK